MADADDEAPEIPDASDPASVKAHAKNAKRKDIRARESVAFMMANEGCREWFYDLLVKCHVGANPFSANPYVTAFNTGELNIGQQVMAAIQDAAPEAYLQMMKENK